MLKILIFYILFVFVLVLFKGNKFLQNVQLIHNTLSYLWSSGFALNVILCNVSRLGLGNKVVDLSILVQLEQALLRIDNTLSNVLWCIPDKFWTLPDIQALWSFQWRIPFRTYIQEIALSGVANHTTSQSTPHKFFSSLRIHRTLNINRDHHDLSILIRRTVIHVR